MRRQHGPLVALLLIAVAVPLYAGDLDNAINSNDAAAVRKLLEADPKLVVKRNAQGHTPLHTAAMGKNLEIVKLLFDAKADVNARADDDCTPLYLAAAGGRKEVAALLLARGADVHAVTKLDRFTPLHRAAQRGSVPVVAMLLAKGAAVDGGWNGKDLSPPITPLHFAVQEGYVDAARLLLAKGATVHAARISTTSTPLYEAVTRGYPELVKLLLRKGADANQKHVFVWAVRSGKAELIQPFLAKGVDFKADSELLYYAAESGKKQLVEMVLAKGVDVNSTNQYRATPLLAAVRIGSTDIVRLLLAKGANANLADSHTTTPLLVAPTREIGALLVEAGAKIDTADKFGQTPLTAAALRGNKALAELLEAKGARHTVESLAALGRTDDLRLLLKKGAPPKSKDTYRPSPLHAAARFGQLKAAQVLIEHGADVNAALPYGETPLHTAAIHGHLPLVELLVEHKAQVNALMTYGYSVENKVTPLWQALDNGHADLVRFLAKAGGMPATGGAKNAAGLLPYALSKKHLAIVKLLFEEGAPLDSRLPDNGTALHLAAALGDLEMVQWLVGKKLDINLADQFGRTPLVHAAGRAEPHMPAAGRAEPRERPGSTAVVAYLLSQGAKDKDGRALFQAAYHGHSAIVELLLPKETGGDADQLQRTALASAVAAGKLDVVKLLHARGTSVTKDVGILHEAVFRGHRDVVAFLLDKGVDVEQFRPDGFNLYYDAFQPRQLAILEFFADKDPAVFKKGVTAVTIEEVNGDKEFGIIGGRPLQAAVAGKQKAIAGLLIDRGASMKVLFPDGSSLLHLATALGDIAMVELLLKHGAPIDVRNQQGQTALALAVERDEEEIAGLLRKHGARE